MSFRQNARLASPAIASAVLTVPARALACSVCAGGNPANRFAFFVMTIVMSLLPLGLFAAAILWLRARLKAHGSSEFVERDPIEPVGRPTLLETAPPIPEELPHPASPAG